MSRTRHPHPKPAPPTPTPTPPPPPPTPSGQVFYVSPGGTGDGSILNPWGTVQRFIDSNPAAGSTLFLRGGIYDYTQGGYTGREVYGSLIGTAEAPITIAAMRGEEASFPDVPGIAFAFWPHETTNRVGASYVVLDGIAFPNVAVSDEAAIVIGGAEPTLYLVNNITVRNCPMGMKANKTSVDHCIGIVHGAEDTVVEDCTFTGAPASGCGIVVYSAPSALRTIVRHCTFRGFGLNALQVWDYASPATASIAVSDSIFRLNGTAIDLRYHDTSSVTACSFDVPSGTRAIYDPNNSNKTTLSGNVYNQ